MKRVLLIPLLALAFAVPAASAADPPTLDGTATITATTATTVTIVYQQTVGPTVTVSWNHYCYANGGPYDASSVFVGSQTAKFTGSGTATFNIGPRKYKGVLYTPDYCFGYAVYQMPSQTALIFAGATTLNTTGQ